MRGVLWGAGVAVVVGVVVGCWAGTGVDGMELAGNYAKAMDWWAGAGDVGGVPWWTPMYLQGTSLATAWGYVLTNVVAGVCGWWWGFPVGGKVAAGVCVVAGGWGMWGLVRAWGVGRWGAGVAGLLYVMGPSLMTRAGGYGHLVVVVAMGVVPWVVRAAVWAGREGGWWRGWVLGMWCGVLVLAYAKTGLMVLPWVALAGVGAWRVCGGAGAGAVWRAAWVGGVVWLVVGVLPNVPGLREAGMAVMFEQGPMEGWQRAFSTKSAVSWLDRDGWIGGGMDAGFMPTTLNGGTYAGVVVMGLVAVLLMHGGVGGSLAGRGARVMLGLAMGTLWLSYGPRGVLGGHMAFLGMSGGAADWVPALGWVMVGVQGWVVWKLVPEGWVGRRWIGGLAVVVYLVVPGFRLVEWLPGYGDIRAPFDFYQVGGVVFLTAAAGMTAGAVLERVRWGVGRAVLACGMVGLAAVDVAPYGRNFFERTMGEGVWEDFVEVQGVLAESEVEGRVYVWSGRYFYLLTPLMSGRPLAAEAFHGYLEQRGTAVLRGTAFLDDGRMGTYLRLAGVSHLLVDKTDPDVGAGVVERLRGGFPVVHENGTMLLLGVPGALGYGFVAGDVVAGGEGMWADAVAALGGAEHGLAVLEVGEGEAGEGLRGRVVEGGRIAPAGGGVLEEGRGFEPVGRRGWGYGWAEFEGAGEAGWMVFNESWHPDWRAVVGGRESEVVRAMVAFGAVRVGAGEVVRWELRPPWWYGVCVGAGVAGWVVALGVAAWRGVSGREGGGSRPSE